MHINETHFHVWVFGAEFSVREAKQIIELREEKKKWPLDSERETH